MPTYDFLQQKFLNTYGTEGLQGSSSFSRNALRSGTIGMDAGSDYFMAMGNSLFGDNKAAQKYAESAQNKEGIAQVFRAANNVKSFEDLWENNGSAGDWVKWLANVGLETTPQIASTIMSGGTAGVIGKLVQGAGSNAVKRQLKNKAKDVVKDNTFRNFAMGGAFLNEYVQAAGDTYAYTGSAEASAVAGGASAALNLVPQLALLSSMSRNLTGAAQKKAHGALMSFIHGGVKQGLLEGGQELAQNEVNQLAKLYATMTTNPDGEFEYFGEAENLMRLESLIAGLGLGGIAGGTGEVASTRVRNAMDGLSNFWANFRRGAEDGDQVADMLALPPPQGKLPPPPSTDGSGVPLLPAPKGGSGGAMALPSPDKFDDIFLHDVLTFNKETSPEVVMANVSKDTDEDLKSEVNQAKQQNADIINAYEGSDNPDLEAQLNAQFNNEIAITSPDYMLRGKKISEYTELELYNMGWSLDDLTVEELEAISNRQDFFNTSLRQSRDEESFSDNGKFYGTRNNWKEIPAFKSMPEAIKFFDGDKFKANLALARQYLDGNGVIKDLKKAQYMLGLNTKERLPTANLLSSDVKNEIFGEDRYANLSSSDFNKEEASDVFTTFETEEIPGEFSPSGSTMNWNQGMGEISGSKRIYGFNKSLPSSIDRANSDAESDVASLKPYLDRDKAETDLNELVQDRLRSDSEYTKLKRQIDESPMGSQERLDAEAQLTQLETEIKDRFSIVNEGQSTNDKLTEAEATLEKLRKRKAEHLRRQNDPKARQAFNIPLFEAQRPAPPSDTEYKAVKDELEAKEKEIVRLGESLKDMRLLRKRLPGQITPSQFATGKQKLSSIRKEIEAKDKILKMRELRQLRRTQKQVERRAGEESYNKLLGQVRTLQSQEDQLSRKFDKSDAQPFNFKERSQRIKSLQDDVTNLRNRLSLWDRFTGDGSSRQNGVLKESYNARIARVLKNIIAIKAERNQKSKGLKVGFYISEETELFHQPAIDRIIGRATGYRNLPGGKGKKTRAATHARIINDQLSDIANTNLLRYTLGEEKAALARARSNFEIRKQQIIDQASTETTSDSEINNRINTDPEIVRIKRMGVRARGSIANHEKELNSQAGRGEITDSAAKGLPYVAGFVKDGRLTVMDLETLYREGYALFNNQNLREDYGRDTFTEAELKQIGLAESLVFLSIHGYELLPDMQVFNPDTGQMIHPSESENKVFRSGNREIPVTEGQLKPDYTSIFSSIDELYPDPQDYEAFGGVDGLAYAEAVKAWESLASRKQESADGQYDDPIDAIVGIMLGENFVIQREDESDAAYNARVQANRESQNQTATTSQINIQRIAPSAPVTPYDPNNETPEQFADRVEKAIEKLVNEETKADQISTQTLSPEELKAREDTIRLKLFQAFDPNTESAQQFSDRLENLVRLIGQPKLIMQNPMPVFNQSSTGTQGRSPQPPESTYGIDVNYGEDRRREIGEPVQKDDQLRADELTASKVVPFSNFSRVISIANSKRVLREIGKIRSNIKFLGKGAFYDLISDQKKFEQRGGEKLPGDSRTPYFETFKSPLQDIDRQTVFDPDRPYLYFQTTKYSQLDGDSRSISEAQEYRKEIENLEAQIEQANQDKSVELLEDLQLSLKANQKLYGNKVHTAVQKVKRISKDAQRVKGDINSTEDKIVSIAIGKEPITGKPEDSEAWTRAKTRIKSLIRQGSIDREEKENEIYKASKTYDKDFSKASYNATSVSGLLGKHWAKGQELTILEQAKRGEAHGTNTLLQNRINQTSQQNRPKVHTSQLRPTINKVIKQLTDNLGIVKQNILIIDSDGFDQLISKTNGRYNIRMDEDVRDQLVNEIDTSMHIKGSSHILGGNKDYGVIFLNTRALLHDSSLNTKADGVVDSTKAFSKMAWVLSHEIGHQFFHHRVRNFAQADKRVLLNKFYEDPNNQWYLDNFAKGVPASKFARNPNFQSVVFAEQPLVAGQQKEVEARKALQALDNYIALKVLPNPTSEQARMRDEAATYWENDTWREWTKYRHASIYGHKMDNFNLALEEWFADRVAAYSMQKSLKEAGEEVKAARDKLEDKVQADPSYANELRLKERTYKEMQEIWKAWKKTVGSKRTYGNTEIFNNWLGEIAGRYQDESAYTRNIKDIANLRDLRDERNRRIEALERRKAEGEISESGYTNAMEKLLNPALTPNGDRFEYVNLQTYSSHRQFMEASSSENRQDRVKRQKVINDITNAGISSFAGRLFFSSADQLDALGPAGRRLRQRIFKRSSSSERPGYINRSTLQFQKWSGDFATIFKGKDAEQQTQILDAYALWRENGSNRLDLTDDIRPYALRLNNYFNKISAYQSGAKPNFNERSNYFPHSFDAEKLKDEGNAGRLVELLRAKHPEMYPTDEDAFNAVIKLRAGLDANLQNPDPGGMSASADQARVWTNITYNDMRNANVAHDPVSSVYKYIREATHSTEFNRVFGAPDANGTWRSDAKLQDALNDIPEQDKDAATKITAGMLGQLGHKVDSNWNKVQSWLMTLQFMATLMFATLASLPDIMMPAIRSREMSGLGMNVRHILKLMNYDYIEGEGLKHNPNARKEMFEFAEMMGTVTNDVVAEAIISGYGSEFMTPASRKASSFFFKAIGLDLWTKTTRVVATSFAREFILTHAFNRTQRGIRYLDELGVNGEEVRSWYENGMDYNTPDGIKVREAMMRFVEESQLRPNPAEKPTYMNDPRWMLLGQLKGFYYSFNEKVIESLTREFFQRRADGEPLAPSAIPVAVAGLALMPLAAVALGVREAIKYEDGQAPTDYMTGTEYMREIYARAGGGGKYEIIGSVFNAPDYGLPMALGPLGPTVQSAYRLGSEGADYLPELVPVYNQFN